MAQEIARQSHPERAFKKVLDIGIGSGPTARALLVAMNEPDTAKTAMAKAKVFLRPTGPNLDLRSSRWRTG